MRYFFIKAIVLSTILLISHRGYAQNIETHTTPTIEDIAWGLGRIIKLDDKIRTGGTGSIQLKKNRARILLSYEGSVKNLMDTWNFIPTFDATSRYILTLQKYPLSCEIAAMKAVFGALGYPTTEDSIIATLPHHNAPMDTKNGIWGDPDKEFVGLYTGSQSQKTGYGIYEGAIEKYFHKTFLKKNKVLYTEAWNTSTRPISYSNESHLTRLLDTLERGGHVIIWGDWCTAPEYEDGVLSRDKRIIKRLSPIPGKNTCKNYRGYRYYNWKTIEGKEVVALSGDHVFLLLGYIGKKESPSHIIIWDTDTGRHIYPTIEWMRKWGMMQNRSLVIYEKNIHNK